MKKKYILPSIFLFLAIILIGLGVAYLFTSEQQEPSVPTEPLIELILMIRLK